MRAAALDLIGIDPSQTQREEAIQDWIMGAPDSVLLVDRLLDRRKAARAEGDFARADAIRDTLAASGVVVKDTPRGTEWEPGPYFDPAKLEAIE